MGNRNDDRRTERCPYQPDNTPSTHPFITFKHFIDDQLSALSRLSTSSFSGITSNMQVAREQQLKDEQEAHYRWTGREVTADHDEMTVQRMSEDDKHAAFDAAMMLVKESAKRNAHVHPSKIEALYHDGEFMSFEHDRFAGPLLSFGGACYYMPETGDNLPSTASLFGRWPRPSPRFLSIDWFKSSSYSPINLERGEPSSSWREAFEELLCASLDKPMQSVPQVGCRPPYMQSQMTLLGPGLDWMLSLYCRGILPLHPSLGAVANSKDRTSFGILESIRSHWPRLAGSWAPHTAEKEFAEIVRAVASPSAPAHTCPSTAKLLVTEQDVANASTRGVARPREVSFIQFLRDNDIWPRELSNESTELWRAIYDEDANKAAKMIVAWEGKGFSTEDLIDQHTVVADYLLMDTRPELWPLCEALEKAHSELLFVQHAVMRSDRKDVSAYGIPTWHLELKQAKFNELEDASKKGIISDEEFVALHIKLSRLNPSPDLTETKAQLAQIWPSKGQQQLPLAVRDEIAQAIPKRQQQLVHPGDDLTEHAPVAASIEGAGILSALTTTQTTRMPDGSITTKIVLKKRFTDGREETTESMQVDYPEQTISTSADDTKKRGWFWS